MATDVELKGKLVDFSRTVSDEIKALRTLINGNLVSLSLLSTQEKSNLVDAINETYAIVKAGGASLEDIALVVDDYFVLHPQSFTYDQQEPASTWLITHPLDHNPNVSIVDSAGTVWVGQISYPLNNQVRVAFNFPLAGKAVLT